MSKQVMEAVPAQAPRYGLLVAAETINDDVRWQDGVEWMPEQCGGGGATSVDCFGGTAAIDDAFTNPTLAEADPFLVYAANKCSTIGFPARDYEGRARRALAATESYQIAREFWTGDIAVADSLDNIPLADITADTVTTTELDPVAALGRLEGALADCGAGRRGMVHVTAQILVHLVASQAVQLAGQQYVTPLGTVVVGDAGYPGSGPNGEAAGATQWAYATSMVQIRLAPVALPYTYQEAVTQAFDLGPNTILVRAERLALVQWDDCCHFAAEINITTPAVAGVS